MKIIGYKPIIRSVLQKQRVKWNIIRPGPHKQIFVMVFIFFFFFASNRFPVIRSGEKIL